MDNVSPFAHFHYFQMAPGRRYYDVVVVKGAFALAPVESKELVEEPPIALVDEPWDAQNAGRSGVRTAGDLLLGKPGTDVLVTGAASAPGGARAEWDTAVLVTRRGQTLLSQHAHVTGPRRWERRLLGWTLSRPEPTSQVPIQYELAYGGAYRDLDDPERWHVHPANPAGHGYADPRAWDPERTYPAPQWEPLDRPVTSPGSEVPLAGFGPIARASQVRLRWAGTYDDAWLERTRAEAAAGLPPDYPPDFDHRFFQCAHPTLTSATHLRGDEELRLAGLVAGHPTFVTRLPGVTVRASLYTGRGPWARETLPMDTVEVDLEGSRIVVSWRLTLDLARGVRAVVLGLEGLE